jgi:hypothetical protein
MKKGSSTGNILILISPEPVPWELCTQIFQEVFYSGQEYRILISSTWDRRIENQTEEIISEILNWCFFLLPVGSS